MKNLNSPPLSEQHYRKIYNNFPISVWEWVSQELYLQMTFCWTVSLYASKTEKSKNWENIFICWYDQRSPFIRVYV